MSISNITSVSRVANATGGDASASPAPSSSRTSAAAGAAASTDADTGSDDLKTPTPPRFPWLSRLAQQLEAAAKQKAAFPSAPVLGDHVDKSA